MHNARSLQSINQSCGGFQVARIFLVSLGLAYSRRMLHSVYWILSLVISRVRRRHTVLEVRTSRSGGEWDTGVGKNHC